VKSAPFVVLLIGQTVLGQPNMETNTVSFAPTSPIIAARSKVKQPEYGRISTNTPAFEDYGVNLMVAMANETAEKWKLDLPHRLGVNDIMFWLKPKPTCIQWILSTRNGRYWWAFDNGWMGLFSDEQNSRRAYLINTNASDMANDEVLSRMANTKSKITEAQAIKMARDYLHAIGLDEKQLRLHEPPKVERDGYKADSGKRYQVPLFAVGWSVEGANPEARLVEITISGITSNIVQYFNANPKIPRVPLPTNYFQMLNLPTNYLETLSRKDRLRLGLPAADGPNPNPSK
jgi:hypothetical protein